MLSIFENRNTIQKAFADYIIEAEIKNKRNQIITSVAEEFYENYDKDSCPIVILQKGPFSQLKFEVDQFSFMYPASFDLQLIVIDYSLRNLKDADETVEQILSDCLEAIENGLNNDLQILQLLRNVEIQSIQYGPSEVESDIYFSDIRAVISCSLKSF